MLALILVAGGALTSLLTLYAMIRVWGRAFWRPVPEVTALDGDAGALQTESGRSLVRPAAGPARGAAPGRPGEGRPLADRHGRRHHGGGRRQPAADGGRRTDLPLDRRAAASMLDRSIYVDAVLGSGVPAPPGSPRPSRARPGAPGRVADGAGG